MVTAMQVPAREDVPKEHTWNAESVFETLEAWQTEYEALGTDLAQIDPYKGTLGNSVETLADYLELISSLRRRMWKLGFYASMSNAVNSLDKDAKLLMGQFGSLAGQFSSKNAFAQPELIAIGEETLMGWVKSNERMSKYEMMFSNLFRQQKYVLASDVEQVMGQINEPFSAARSIAGELSNTDLQFDDATGSDGNTLPITQSSIRIAKGSPDREIRRTGWQNYADSYLAFKNTFAAAYGTSVKQNTVEMRIRGYDNVLQMMLFPHNLPNTVFHNLIDVFKKNLPTWHRYWDIKRRVLGYDSIHPWDIWAPMTQNEPQISFEQAVDYIAAGMEPLGSDYVNTLRKGCLEERWVDYAVNKGKRQGAFSGGAYDTFPFIMMSFDDQLSGLSTLAHELGHSMHSYMSRSNQPEEYAGYSMFAAETASNFNQAMTRAYLFEQNDDRDFQLALIQEAMDNFHRYFFIMPTLARFEYEVHERAAAGKPLTADILNGIMSDLYAEGYGDTMTDDSERTGITWAQFGHLFLPYYTFQYATGISAAHALADKVRTGDPQAAENYLSFLAAGSSIYPLEALKMAGVDMTTPEPIEKTFAVLGELVDRLESLI